MNYPQAKQERKKLSDKIKLHDTIEKAMIEYNLLKNKFSSSWIAFDASNDKFQVMIYPQWLNNSLMIIKVNN